MQTSAVKPIVSLVVRVVLVFLEVYGTKFNLLFSLLVFHKEYTQFFISWVPWYTTLIRLSVKNRWLLAKMGKLPGKFSHYSTVCFVIVGL